jgi:hypothetical protein
MSLNENETRGIRANLILEVIGRPPEHLVQTLGELIEKIDEEEGVQVLEKKVHEPELMKDQDQFYSSFAEIVVEVEEIVMLAGIMFKYMPAHVEVIEPELIALTNNGWNEILNEVTLKLHKYDDVARIITNEKNLLEKKLKELIGEKKEDQNGK